MLTTRLLTGLLVLSLAACAVGPRYQRPAVSFDEHWVSAAATAPVDATWWRSLNDALLTELIETAVLHNLDLKQADARLREARASRDAAAGQRLPQATVDSSAKRDRLSKNGEIPLDRIPGFHRDIWLYEIGFDASWEIDLWGHQSRAVEAATDRAEAAEDARRDALLRVIAETVRSYVDLRSAQQQLQSAGANAQAQDGIAKLIDSRFQAGESSRFDLLRAQAQAQATRAALPDLEAMAQTASFQLSVLSGQAPEALAGRLSAPAALSQSPTAVAVGLRSDLLRRRPDIRQAERQLAAQTADVGVATAELFPRLSLVGSIGQQAQDGGALLRQGSNEFSIGPSLHWPVFAGGSIRANIRAANARAEEAAAHYEGAVLNALNDSESAINRFAAAQRTQQDRDIARQQSEDALALARQRYRAGEDDLLVLLDAQSAYSASEQQSIVARAAALNAFASLYKALGGGWENAESAVAARQRQ